MKKELSMQQIKEACLNVQEFPKEVLDWTHENNWWNIWVPKEYGGLEYSLTEGLKQLKDFAKIDGTLGWTLTLCSGANFFIGNLQKDVAKELFNTPNICLGGSGGNFGTAEKNGNEYILNGKWRYATGSKYLTHFTLNAQVTEKGIALKNEDGTPQIRSFIIPKEKVTIIEDWNTMGLVASITNSFNVENVTCDKKYSFLYKEVYLPQPLYQIDFSTFADLTLWVNYIGMAEHFLEQVKIFNEESLYAELEAIISNVNQEIAVISTSIETLLNNGDLLSQDQIQDIHLKAKSNVRAISLAIISIYPFLGIKAASYTYPINQIFRDYFTATQHHIFVKR
ncbi:acyl-CoA dehydrogenase family protein [Brumimicrobium mesophilum]|uniref:acyl-CoA dehydrogenase n=1 Tax=Brumimicrobium mesophilum TaxID=392717 RepID=UPI001F244450|nr:acyl-CoA dehydrogenase [Brumimicrobium mesophilum]